MKDAASRFEELKLRFPQAYKKHLGNVEIVDHSTDDGYRVTAIRGLGQDPVIYETPSKSERHSDPHTNYDIMGLLSEGLDLYQAIAARFHVGKPFSEDRDFQDLTKEARIEIREAVETLSSILKKVCAEMKEFEDEKPVFLGDKKFVGNAARLIRRLSKRNQMGDRRRGPDEKPHTIMAKLRPFNEPEEIVAEFYPSKTGGERLSLIKDVSEMKSQLTKRQKRTISRAATHHP
jgi:hypothetical protein